MDIKIILSLTLILLPLVGGANNAGQETRDHCNNLANHTLTFATLRDRGIPYETLLSGIQTNTPEELKMDAQNAALYAYMIYSHLSPDQAWSARYMECVEINNEIDAEAKNKLPLPEMIVTEVAPSRTSSIKVEAPQKTVAPHVAKDFLRVKTNYNSDQPNIFTAEGLDEKTELILFEEDKIADQLVDAGDYKSAIDVRMLIVTVLETKTPSSPLLGNSLNKLASVRVLNGDFDQAETDLIQSFRQMKKSLEEGRTKGSLEQQSYWALFDSLEILAELYRKQDQTPNAVATDKLLKHWRDDFENIRRVTW